MLRLVSVTAAVLDLTTGPVHVRPEDALGAIDTTDDEGDFPDLTNLHITGHPNLFASAALNDRSRDEMPVVEPEDAPKFLAYLADLGIESAPESVDPVGLSATQNELNAAKVSDMAHAMLDGTMGDDVPPIISSDNRVLDGHHRWAAAAILALTDPGRKLDVIRVDVRMPDLLDLADDWHAANGAESKDRAAAVVAAMSNHPAGKPWHLRPVESVPSPTLRWPRGSRRAGQFARIYNRRPEMPADPAAK